MVIPRLLACFRFLGFRSRRARVSTGIVTRAMTGVPGSCSRFERSIASIAHDLIVSTVTNLGQVLRVPRQTPRHPRRHKLTATIPNPLTVPCSIGTHGKNSLRDVRGRTDARTARTLCKGDSASTPHLASSPFPKSRIGYLARTATRTITGSYRRRRLRSRRSSRASPQRADPSLRGRYRRRTSGTVRITTIRRGGRRIPAREE